MHKFSTNIDARRLLNTLADAGQLDAASSERAEKLIVEQAQHKELALHLRILSGVGAFIAALFFIGFLAAAKVITLNSEGAMMVWGAVFIGAAIGLLIAIRGDGGSVTHSFLQQSSLSAMGIGKILFVIGVSTAFKRHEEWGVTFGIFIVTVGTYFFYRMSIDRFLSILALLVSITINLTLGHLIDVSSTVVMNVFFLAQLGIAALFLIDSKFKREHIAVPYAAVFGLCFTIVHLVTIKSWSWRGWIIFDMGFMNYVLMAAFIGLIVWAAGDLQRLKAERLLLAVIAALCLGLLSAPGILLALGLMVVGYAKHELLLTALGVLLMPVTLFHYYYSLDVTLLMKSGILVGSGAVMLAGYAYMTLRKFDNQVQP